MTEKYRGFNIENICPPIPIRSHDWCAQDDGDEERQVFGGTLEDCKEAVDELLNEAELDRVADLYDAGDVYEARCLLASIEAEEADFPAEMWKGLHGSR